MPDVVSGVALLVVAAVYWRWAAALPQSGLDDNVGAAGLPLLLAALLAGLSLFLILRGAIAWRRAARLDLSGHGRAAAMLGIGVGYMLIAPMIGYAAAIALLIAAVARFQGVPAGWPLFATAVGGAAFFWALFVGFLDIGQPAGWGFR